METNKIYQEDNLETLKKTANNFFDMAITSPPYDSTIGNIMGFRLILIRYQQNCSEH